MLTQDQINTLAQEWDRINAALAAMTGRVLSADLDQCRESLLQRLDEIEHALGEDFLKRRPAGVAARAAAPPSER